EALTAGRAFGFTPGRWVGSLKYGLARRADEADHAGRLAGKKAERRTRGRSTGPRQGARSNSTRPDAPCGAWSKALLRSFKGLSAQVGGFCESRACHATNCRRGRLCGRGLLSRSLSFMIRAKERRPAPGRPHHPAVYPRRGGTTRCREGFLPV